VESESLLLLGLRARAVSSRRDGSKIFFANSLYKHLKSLHIKHHCTYPYTDLIWLHDLFLHVALDEPQPKFDLRALQSQGFVRPWAPPGVSKLKYQSILQPRLILHGTISIPPQS
jgi:hypothetical protein